MSLELEVKELREAVVALNVTISALVNDANFGKIAAPSTQASTGTVAGVNGGTSEEKPKRTRKPVETKAVETAVEEFEDVSAATTEAAADDFDLGLEEEAAPEVTAVEVKAILSDVSKKKGREPLLRLFKDVGAATFPDIKPENYGKIYAAAKELLG